MNVKELNEKYQRVKQLHGEAFALLIEYVHETLKLNGGSIGFKVKDYDQCEEDGEEYYGQFPSSVDIDGRHGMFSVMLTEVRLTEDGQLRIDGEEQAEWGNEWHKDLYTREDYDTYYSVAFFIDEVLRRQVK